MVEAKNQEVIRRPITHEPIEPLTPGFAAILAPKHCAVNNDSLTRSNETKGERYLLKCRAGVHIGSYGET